MYFTFKGITSTSLGIIVESMSNFQKPQRRSDMKYIDGKAGATVTEYGYAPYIIKAVIGVKKNADIDTIIAWLDGTGVLICSDDPLKYRDVKVLGDIDYEKLLRFKKAKVDFYVADPFRYVIAESDITLTSSGTIANTGTVASMPLLKVTGSGTVALTFGGVFSFSYIFPVGETYFYFDFDSLDCYYNIPTALRNRSITMGTSDVPHLPVGNTTLSLTGMITQVIVTKRTRYL